MALVVRSVRQYGRLAAIGRQGRHADNAVRAWSAPAKSTCDGFNLALQHTGVARRGRPREGGGRRPCRYGRQAERLPAAYRGIMTGIVFSIVLLPVMPAISAV